GRIDWDLRIFDNLIPLPEGTSYNSYLVQGSEKTALIDTTNEDGVCEFIANLDGTGVSSLDYLVINHLEQDHSSAIPEVLEKYPDCKLIVSNKGRKMLFEMYEIDEARVHPVKGGDAISLGDTTLEFIDAPWVHWPETMMTLAREPGVLFSCDLFGAHLASSSLFASEIQDVYSPAKRYYAEIMMPYRSHIQKYLGRLKDYKIQLIAPSHGPVFDNPEQILALYRDWVSDETDGSTAITFISMHGTTDRVSRYLANALIDRGQKVELLNLAEADIGKVAMATVDARFIIMATSTVINSPHPIAASTAYLLNLLKPKCPYFGVLSAFGWGAKADEILKGMLPNLNAEFLETVKIRNSPKKEDFFALDKLAGTIAAVNGNA
ncbi:MAG: FprA family A-type flavoprotein, partial [Verrucomicrobia bacterium]|nr:FprA family A-type flavoprotein [Verrucomicrobiota bacterium]